MTQLVERRSPQQVTHSPLVWDLLLPLDLTPGRKDQRLLVSLPKDTDKVRCMKLPKFPNGSRLDGLHSVLPTLQNILI